MEILVRFSHSLNKDFITYKIKKGVTSVYTLCPYVTFLSQGHNIITPLGEHRVDAEPRGDSVDETLHFCYSYILSFSSSIQRNIHIPIGDLLLQILGVLSVDSAPDGHARAEDLLDGAGQILGHRSRPHDLGDLDYSGCGGDDGDLGLTVLNSELDGDAEAFPILGRLLGDVLTDLLRGETERTDLGGERAGSADLSSGDPDENVDDLRGIELRRHADCWSSMRTLEELSLYTGSLGDGQDSTRLAHAHRRSLG
ncbi:glutamate dehydrogenase [Striga asiatica]|uniref:Glutamate dehydrogenase n=1 Tax=Striga asiatica TaxID=4170 RepID=A0A5A7RKT3_STRAF|nr:glutamate dehydrogenase [Striga asiatica]